MDGSDILREDGYECLVDGTHVSDMAFYRQLSAVCCDEVRTADGPEDLTVGKQISVHRTENIPAVRHVPIR